LEKHFNSIRIIRKNDLIKYRELFAAGINSALKEKGLKKMNYENCHVWRKADDMGIKWHLNGKDVFSGYYMQEKNDYEENLRKWEKLKFEITHRKNE
jgi:hypothetical protein